MVGWGLEVKIGVWNWEVGEGGYEGLLNVRGWEVVDGGCLGDCCLGNGICEGEGEKMVVLRGFGFCWGGKGWGGCVLGERFGMVGMDKNEGRMGGWWGWWRGYCGRGWMVMGLGYCWRDGWGGEGGGGGGSRGVGERKGGG
uniref:Uncharacterized protein n=1 Tax=Knipowitschia caucasica TaxID=637954 RepID=A0AAV2KAY6_KNICA